jgi:hypothetical protein
MKALSMLDPVMLWIARGFACIMILLSASSLWSGHLLGAATSASLEFTEFAIYTIWLLGSFYLNKLFVRIIAGIFSGLFLAIALLVMGSIFFTPLPAGSEETFQIKALMLGVDALSVIGFAAMTWVAVRPPHTSKSQPVSS